MKWLVSLVLFSQVLYGQSFIQKDIHQLKKHVSTLSSDQMEGRLTGTAGEKKALEYISKQWKKYGIKEHGEKGFLHSFEFTYRIVPDENNKMWIVSGNKTEVSNTDFYPVTGSGCKEVTAMCVKVGYGIRSLENNYNDYAGHTDLEGKIFIIQTGDPDQASPHSKYADFNLQKRIALALEYGAAGIVFINSNPSVEDPESTISSKIKANSIPVVFCKKHELFMNDGFTVGLKINYSAEKRTGNNVIGFIDNKAAQTIVIGAHYDHLGYGDEGSLYRGERAIHNGADDNASGTALMIELSNQLKKSDYKNNNYLFIGFSGEELGLLGSGAFTKSELMNKYNINYMINMDMVGRLDSTDRTIIIHGTGTSPIWNTILNQIKEGSFKIKATESGIGPSDHTSFYLKDIPVLHFFTGTHNDYHKPSDDWEKINLQGMADIGNYILSIIREINDDGKIAFTKTKEPEGGKVSSFKVSLGVIPDYSYEGEGMRIDGVSEGKPAQIGGLKAGDIIIQIGDEKVKDIYAYMAALGKFKKGEDTTVKIKRANEELKMNIKF
jgi:aminopeptidase YwaD